MPDRFAKATAWAACIGALFTVLTLLVRKVEDEYAHFAEATPNHEVSTILPWGGLLIGLVGLSYVLFFSVTDAEESDTEEAESSHEPSQERRFWGDAEGRQARRAAIEAEHDAVREELGRYYTDLRWLEHPALNDVSVAQTATAADGVRPRRRRPAGERSDCLPNGSVRAEAGVADR